MCGRYTLATSPEKLQQEFNLNEVPPLASRYNIAPSQPVPIITNDKPHELTMVQWGLIPSWSKDPKIGYKMINARAETAAEKPSFRSAFKRRRCLIPASGFYEWRKEEGVKQPYYIQTKRDVFGFAGLWEIWNSPEGEVVYTCTILTAEPNDLVSDYHHRMAVVLPRDAYEIWLDDTSERNQLESLLLDPYPSDEMMIHPVSREVNSPANDGAHLIDLYQPPQQQTLL